MLTMHPIRTLRMWAGRLLITILLVVPFIKIQGESAFRFDIATLKLHFLGATIWMQEFFYVFLMALFVTALFLFFNMLLGRVWCGWFCPQTVFCDLTEVLINKRKNTGKGMASFIAGHLVIGVVSLVLGFTTVCYFISPYDAIPAILSWSLNPVAAVSMLVIAGLIYLDLGLLRRTFCSTICPYAKIQSILTDRKSLTIAMSETRKEECIKCMKCVRSCPTGVDIREGMQVACIMCAECVDACNGVMAKMKKKGLIAYQFGVLEKARLADLLRPGVLGIGIAALVFFSALVWQVSQRTPFDFTVLPHSMEPRLTKEGDVLNAFILSVKNKGQENLAVRVEFAGDEVVEGFSHSATDVLEVPAGLVEKFPLFVRKRGGLAEDRKINLSLHDASDKSRVVGKKVFFTKP